MSNKIPPALAKKLQQRKIMQFGGNRQVAKVNKIVRQVNRHSIRR